MLWSDGENSPKNLIELNVSRYIQSSSDGKAVVVGPGASVVQASDSDHDRDPDYDSENDSHGGEDWGEGCLTRPMLPGSNSNTRGAANMLPGSNSNTRGAADSSSLWRILNISRFR